MKLWISCYGISIGYLDSCLGSTCENKTQMGMGLRRDSIDVRGLSTMIYLCTHRTSGTGVDTQH